MTDSALHPAWPEDETERAAIALLVSNEVMGRGLEAVLRSLPGVGTVQRCNTRGEAVELLREQQFDVVVVTGRDHDWLAEARCPAPTRTLVIVDTLALAGPATRVEHADGYLSQQDLSAQTLSDSLRRVRSGEVPMPAELARALLTGAEAPPVAAGSRPVRLTSRESEVLRLLTRGLSNKQIATRLSISSHGVKRLVGNIMMKLDAPNRTAAVVTAISAGMIEPD